MTLLEGASACYSVRVVLSPAPCRHASRPKAGCAWNLYPHFSLEDEPNDAPDNRQIHVGRYTQGDEEAIYRREKPVGSWLQAQDCQVCKEGPPIVQPAMTERKLRARMGCPANFLIGYLVRPALQVQLSRGAVWHRFVVVNGGVAESRRPAARASTVDVSTTCRPQSLFGQSLLRTVHYCSSSSLDSLVLVPVRYRIPYFPCRCCTRTRTCTCRTLLLYRIRTHSLVFVRYCPRLLEYSTYCYIR